MVRIYLDGYGHCSGTLLTRGWILTAGHCVHDGYKGGGYISPGRLKVVPGNSASNGLRTKPYGEYLVRRVLAADGWESVTQLGQDWGMIEVYPNGSGYYPGDYTGTYSATWNADVDEGEVLSRTGYPGEPPFEYAQYGGGEYQYHCNHYWSGELVRDGLALGLYDKPCNANGGASGGPVFWYDGTRWTIIGVNNRGDRDPITNWGMNATSFWFDNYFGQFWNKVRNTWTD